MNAPVRLARSTLPRAIDQLGQPEMRTETVRRISGARVVWADYRLILHDFPALGRDCASATEGAVQEVDDWLVAQAAVMSEPQCAANEVNGAIPTTADSTPACRPPRYGRAVIVEVAAPGGRRAEGDGQEPCGLVDVKGCGVAPGTVPRAALDATGLVNLPEAIREVVMYRLINEVFRLLNVDVAGVGIYAVLDLGFRGRLPDPNGWTAPAALIVRQAHRRIMGNNDVPPKRSDRQRISMQVELMLRQFGLTSSGPCSQLFFDNDGDGVVTSYGRGKVRNALLDAHAKRVLDQLGLTSPCAFDCVNVQFAWGATVEPLRARLFDFGQYEYRPRFDLHLLSTVRDRPFNWGGVFLTSAPDWLQPAEGYRLDAEVFAPRHISEELANWRGSGRERVLSGFVEFSNELTKRVEQRTAGRKDLALMIDEFIERALRPTRDFFQAAAFQP